MPGVFAGLDGWLERHPGAGFEFEDFDGHDPVFVTGRAGDLVILDSRLPHGNGPNTADAPRLVQYVAMFPETTATRSGRPGSPSCTDQVARIRSGTAAPGGRVLQPWPPAQLTPLGRRLAGLDPWPENCRCGRADSVSVP